jgi:uncharacterized protein DUF4397
MKKLAIIGIGIVGLMACKKEYDSIYNFSNKDNTAKVKLVHALTNATYSSKGTATAPLQIFINGNKLTGNNITAGTGVFPNLEFALVPSGSVELKAIIPKTDTTAEAEAMKKTVTLENGQTYSVFIADTIPTATAFIVKEDLTAVADSGKYFVRYVNLTAKSTGYDFLNASDKDTFMIFNNQPYLSASAWQQMNVATGARAFVMRRTGNNANVISFSFTPTAGRMFTIFSYGVDDVKTGFKTPRAASYTTRFQTYQY